MTVRPIVLAAAASSLLADVLDASCDLVEVARTAVSVHYETGRADVPVLCVCDPSAVRLPNALVTPVLPTGSASVHHGALSSGRATWRVARWWQPPRPHGLTRPDLPVAVPGVDVPSELRPELLVGAGPGLTPAGDDVLAGALVAAHATCDPRLVALQTQTRAALGRRGTTAVSRGLLTHALDGWATPELAAFVTAVCAGDAAAAAARLLAVGHSSGASLAAGALHVLRPSYAVEGAA